MASEKAGHFAETHQLQETVSLVDEPKRVVRARGSMTQQSER